MHPHLRARLAALSLILLGSTLSADTLTGRVVDVNGVGLAGIDIDAVSVSGGGNPHLTNDGTDANGNFSATIDPGLYRLTFYAAPPPATTLLAGVLDNVVVSGVKNVGTIVLQPGVSLSGRTLDSAGLPLAGVKVVVKRDDTGAIVPMKNATSNAFGNFAVAVPTTALTIELDPTAIVLRTLVPARTSATPSGATNLGNLTLLDGFVLSGSVTNLSGVPINGVDLDVLVSATGEKLWTPGDRTSGLGAFTLRVPPGTYDVQFCPSLATRLVAREFKDQVVGASMNTGAVALAPGVQLSGRVFDASGTPRPGVDLAVDLSSTGASILTCNDDTNATGNYAVIVPAGTLDVSFAFPGRHGTSAADLHAGFVVAGDTVLDGVLPAPTALFAGAPLSGPAPLAVQFADLSTGVVTSWLWNFGDGATSTDASPSHTYALDGNYTVSLTVDGTGGAHTRTEPAFVSVGLAAPVAEFIGAPLSGTAPLVVAFANQSSGTISAHLWSFGDGATSSDLSPSHPYTTPGTYTVALTETGPGGASTRTRTDYIVVAHPAPVAEFLGAPLSGTAPLVVAFANQSSGTISAHLWSFGDGATSSDLSPSHTYTTPGTYTVALTETGPGGASTRTRTDYIVVAHPAPVADFSADVRRGKGWLPVRFTDLSSGPIASWSWNFGDGTGSSGQNPVHIYRRPGVYTVTLTVTGPGGTDLEARTGFVVVNGPSASSTPTGTAGRTIP